MKHENTSALWVESTTHLSIEQLTQITESIATQNNWKVLITHNLQASLAKHGQEVLPIVVMELCNPAISGKLLGNDDERVLSVFMPCRISIYEKSDGTTYLTRMNAPLLKPMLPPHAGAVMQEAYVQMEAMIAQILATRLPEK